MFSEGRETWQMAEDNPKLIGRLSRQLKLPRLLAKIITARNIGDGHTAGVKQFINPKKSYIGNYKLISDPLHLNRAIERLITACKKGEKVVVNGDPDADGITSATIMVAALKHLGADVKYDFPIRCLEGHGLQARIIDEAKEWGANVIVTTDCGTKDLETVEYATKKGMDVIITDHHIVGKTLPKAYAIVNPFMIKSPLQNKSCPERVWHSN